MKTVSYLLFTLLFATHSYAGSWKITSNGIEYCLIEIAALRLATSPQNQSVYKTVVQPLASAGGVHSVGRASEHSNSSFQIGCTAEQSNRFPGKSGTLVYEMTPQSGHSVYLNIVYSSSNHLATSRDRVTIYYDNNFVAAFTPQNTGSWSTYTSIWLDVSDAIPRPQHTSYSDLKLETSGQNYGSAMIASIELSDGKNEKITLSASELPTFQFESQNGLNYNYQPNAPSKNKAVISIGAGEYAPWNAESASARFQDIDSSFCDLLLTYSKHSPSNTPIFFTFNGKRRTLYPRSTGSWNAFRTDRIDFCS